MTLFTALVIGPAADILIGVALVCLVRAHKRYETEKLARWRADGIYWPESVDAPPDTEIQNATVG